MLIEIWYKCRIEARRRKIAEDAQVSLAAFRAGEYQPQPVTKIIAELRYSLGEDKE